METQNYSSGQESYLDKIISDQEPVTKNTRFINYLIDVVVFYIIIIIEGVILDLTGNIAVAQDKLIGYLMTFGTIFLYYFLMEKTSGRTVGKLLTGTKVVALDGSKPTANQILLRSLSRLVPFDAFSFFGDHGWHDKWSDTMVVKKSQAL